MLQIAKVLKSNGTDGAVLAGFRDIDPEEIDLKEPVFINFDGLPVPFFIESLQKKGTLKAILRLTGISSLRDAEEIVGSAIYADLEMEESSEEDFTGWDFYDHGVFRGKVSDIEDIPGNPCLYIAADDGREVLIPLHGDFIESVDPEAHILRMNLPEGLM